jgi:phytoene/squalene synthetase
MDFQIDRARELLLRGAPLVHALPGRIGWEIRLTVQGGLRILDRLRRVRGNVFQRRPTLGKWDWLVVAGRSLTM